jgi:hypothetical protein
MVTVLEVVGLVGIVVVISSGKIFDPLREFLRSFSHPYNPSRWLAELISCSMCSGVWVGFLWGVLHRWPWERVIVFAGFLSVLSYVTTELFRVLGRLSGSQGGGRAMQYVSRGDQVVALAEAKSRLRRRPRKVAPGDDISEEEADALLDQEIERADAAVS